MSTSYIAIKPNELLQFEAPAPIFKCGIISDFDTDNAFKNAITKRLYDLGCLYFCAWGHECEDWHDTIDWNILEKHDYNDIPDDQFCLTTWHDNQPLTDMLFCLKILSHTYLEGDIIEDALLIHITNTPDEENIVEQYKICDDDEYLD